jgi:hypothetical protein
MKPIFTRERVLPQITEFFKRAETFKDLDSRKCAAHVGCWRRTLTLLVGKAEWHQMKTDWVRDRLLRTMDEVYGSSSVREQFTVARIIRQAGALGKGATGGSPISRVHFHQLVGGKWKEMAATLPAQTEVMPKKRYYYPPKPKPRPPRPKVAPPADHQKPIPLSESLTPGADEWDLRGVKGILIKRSKLRPDLAEMAWSILWEELCAAEIAPGTVGNHHYGFVLVGQLLGADVPDIRHAALEPVQKAWCKYNGSLSMKSHARQAMTQLVSRLIVSEVGPPVDKAEMLRILCWLNSVKLNKEKPNDNYLSQAEMEMVIMGCSLDIANGLAFIKDHPDWADMSTRVAPKVNASALIDWATGLMVLLMAVTGLRCQSLIELEVDSWVQIDEDMFALAYHHGKTTGEKVVAVPGLVIKSLDRYREVTDQIRRELSTNRLFLNGDNRGYLIEFKGQGFLKRRLEQFVRRHRIERDNVPVSLNPSVMRRTYATRELVEGRGFHVVQAQLGHVYPATTEIYVKFDRFEHPARVREALDRYGRIALTTWKRPVLLETLSPEERRTLLANRCSRHQDVGLCRHDHCVQLQQGGPPPCSLCEHLVTGPEFLGTWRSERNDRLVEIRRLSGDPSDSLQLAEKQHQLSHFEANLAFVERQVSE